MSTAEVLAMDPTVALVVAFVVPSITVLIWEAVALRRQARCWPGMAEGSLKGAVRSLESEAYAEALLGTLGAPSLADLPRYRSASSAGAGVEH
jgi:hypothetical protein